MRSLGQRDPRIAISYQVELTIIPSLARVGDRLSLFCIALTYSSFLVRYAGPHSPVRQQQLTLLLLTSECRLRSAPTPRRNNIRTNSCSTRCPHSSPPCLSPLPLSLFTSPLPPTPLFRRALLPTPRAPRPGTRPPALPMSPRWNPLLTSHRLCALSNKALLD